MIIDSLIKLVETYGYKIVFISALFEGEVVLVLAGLAVFAGYLTISGVFLAAIIGAIVGDTSWFLLGKYKGEVLVAKWSFFSRKVNKSKSLPKKRSEVLILVMRFIYGFRTIIPFVLGISKFKTSKFLIFNLVSAFVWVIIIGTSGYIFGSIIETLLGKIKYSEFIIVIFVSLAFTFGRAISRYIKRTIEEEIHIS